MKRLLLPLMVAFAFVALVPKNGLSQFKDGNLVVYKVKPVVALTYSYTARSSTSTTPNTLTSVSSVVGLSVGMVVTGSGVSGLTITAIPSSSSITLSGNATVTNSTAVSYTFQTPGVPLTGNTNSNTTINGLSATSGLSVGMSVYGTGIPTGATIATIPDNSSVTISSPSSSTGTSVALTFYQNPNFVLTGTTNSSTTISLSSTASLAVGMSVLGSGIPSGATIATIPNSTSITISSAATTSVSGVALTFVANSTILTGTTASTTTISGLSSNAGLAVGALVSGAGIIPGTTIASIPTGGTSVTLSLAATASASVSLTFGKAVIVPVGSPIVVDEYNTSTANQTAAVSNYSLPYTFGAAAGTNDLVILGLNSSSAFPSANGLMTRSQNGRYLIVPGYQSALNAAVSTTNAGVRLLNGSVSSTTINAGSGTWTNLTAGNGFRGAISDDGTNLWLSGTTTSPANIQYTTSAAPATVVNLLSGSINARAISIFNNKLYYSSGSTNGSINQVGTGAPPTSGTTTPTNTGAINYSGGSPYQFSVSPDNLTVYFSDNNGTATGGVYRSTYSGTYSSGVYASGSWTITKVYAGFYFYGIVVDWNNYSFNVASANGAVVYANTHYNIITFNDAGTSAVTPTILRTVDGVSECFKGLSFTPIKQTVAIGTNTPASSTFQATSTNNVLFQFKVTANEGISTVKKVILSNGGTADLSRDFSNYKLLVDANDDGVADASEISASTTVTGSSTASSVTFSGISLTSYLTEGTSVNFLVIADVPSSALYPKTFIPTIAANQTSPGGGTTVNYTTNIVNAGASWVNIASTGVVGNTFTTAASPTPSLSPSVSSLSVTTYVEGSGPAASGTNFTVDASNLSGANKDITITAPSNYEVSTTSATTGFGTTATITNSSASFTAANVWIRLTAGLAYTGNYNSKTVTLSGGGVSPNVTITVSGSVSATPPTVTLSPNSNDISYCIYQTATQLQANVTDAGVGTTATCTYQWYKNSTASTSGATSISGATNATYTPPSSTAGFNYYYCVVTNTASAVANSPFSGKITVTAGPTVTLTTTSAVLYSGQSATFTASGSVGASSYQWTKNGSDISAATSSSYVASTSSIANGDVINCVYTATNATCAAASSGITMSLPTTTAFTAGSLVVERVGDGVTSNVANGGLIVLDQYNTSGSKTLSVPFQYSVGAYPSSANYSLTTSASASTEGYITLSSDGAYISVPGYNAPLAASSVSSSSTTSAPATLRTVGVAAADGTATVPIAADMLSGTSIRSVVSDGTQFWVNGASGFYYFTSKTDNAGFSYSGTNLRTINIFNGTIYVGSGSSPYVGLNTMGTITGLRDNGSASQQNITPDYPKTSPQAFVFNPTGDVLYIADDAGGILKFNKSASNGLYYFAYYVTTTNVRGLVADFSGTNPVLYATSTTNTIVKVTDAGSTASTTLVASATGNSIFKGLAWAPSASQIANLYVNTNYLSTAFNSAFGSTSIGVAATNTGNNFFALGGNFVSSNVVITPPVGFEISTSATFSTVYTNSSPLTISAATLALNSSSSIQQIYVRFKPASAGAFSGNINITSSGAITRTVAVTGTGIQPTVYYYKGTGSLTAPSSYLDGSNNPATNLSVSGVTWYIQNGGNGTIGSSWALGTNSTVYVGGGASSFTLNVAASYAISGGNGIIVDANGIVNWNNTNTPTFSSLITGSTINYAASGNQSIAVATYSNLSIGGSGTKTFSASTYTIDNNFTVTTNASNVVTTGSTIYFNGATQNVPGITYNNLTISSSGTATATGNITTTGTLFIEQGTFTIPATYTYTQIGTIVTVGSVGNTCSLTVNGTFNNGSPTGTVGTTCATISITTGSSISFNASTSVYNHYGNGGSIPKATWNAASNCNVLGLTSTSVTASSFGQTFGNFTWNNSNQAADIVVGNALFITQGPLNVISTGSSNYFALAGGANATYSGNSFASMNISGGKFYTCTRTASFTPTISITVAGNITVSNSAIMDIANGGGSQTSLSYPTTLSVGGDITVGTSASLKVGNTNVFNHGKIVFTKAGTQLYGNAGTGGQFDLVINSGSVVKLTKTTTQVYSASAPDAITNNGTIDLNGNTVTFNTITGSGILKGSSTSSLSINGAANNTLIFDQTTPGTTNLIGNLTMTSTGTNTLSNALNLIGTLTPTSGTLVSNGNLTIKSTGYLTSGVVAAFGTATITGNVTVERNIPMGYFGYRDLSSGVYNTSNTIYNTWQLSGNRSTPGYGIFITGPGATDANTANYTSGQPAPSATGLDYSINGNASAYTYDNGDPNGRFNWNYGGTTSNVYTPGAIPHGITNTTITTLDPLKGFRVLVRGDRTFNLALTPIINYYKLGMRMVNTTTLSASGKLIAGTVTYLVLPGGVIATAADGTAITSTNGLNPNAAVAGVGGWSMVTNPYVCPVFWGTPSSHLPGTSVFGSSSGLNATFWFLNPTYGGNGSYDAYNAFSGSVYADGSNSTPYIQAGQAFFVQSATTAPSLVFKETAKLPAQTKLSIFGVTAPLSKIYVSLNKLSTSGYSRVDGAAIAFSNEFGNTTYGPQDALKFGNANDNLSISDKGKSLSIDGRLPATASDILPIAVSKVNNTSYQLVVDATSYSSNGYLPVLKDSYKGTETNLTLGVNTIDFVADSLVAASFANRFSLGFKPTTLAVNSIVASATLNNKIATISWNTVGEKGIARFEVEKSTDAKAYIKIGQAIAKNTTNATYTSIDNSANATTTYYRVKSISDVGTVSYSNIAKVSINISPITLYPNPLKGSKVLNITMGNLAAGKYTVTITNVLGQKVGEETIIHQIGSATHAISISNTLSAGSYSVSVRDANNKSVYQSNLSVQL